VWALGLCVAVAVVGGLALRGDIRALVVDGAGILAVWLATAVCWLAVSRVGLRRPRVVLGIALDQVSAWHAQGRALSVAVNLSASSLVDTDLPEEVASMLVAQGVPPGALQLEITEEFLMADRDRGPRHSDPAAPSRCPDLGG
jgi:EAL domain